MFNVANIFSPTETHRWRPRGEGKAERVNKKVGDEKSRAKGKAPGENVSPE